MLIYFKIVATEHKLSCFHERGGYKTLKVDKPLKSFHTHFFDACTHMNLNATSQKHATGVKQCWENLSIQVK